jgi:ribosomal protein S12 methylthiotransferase
MEAGIRVSLISLGCPKNLVDSEVLLGHAAREGLLIAHDPEDADVAVINTCGFIDSAKAESIQTILEVARLKEDGQLKGLIVVGCLSERYGQELQEELPEVDAILGLSDYSKVPALIHQLARRGASSGSEAWVPDTRGGQKKTADSDKVRLLMTPRSFAYLRIGEGCDHSCTFCAIPAIRGEQRSKPIETLVEEAQGIAQGGVRELVLVAEDSTAYGMDWGGKKRMLPELLAALGRVDGIEWLRVLYAYPHTVLPAMTEQLRENPKVLPYLDIPIQHISSPMLKAMKRGVKSAQVRGILDRLRAEVPGIAVRSTYIVGFPGETEEDFEALLELTRDYAFERLGVFPYSKEEGTPAFDLGDEVAPELAEERMARIMEVSRELIQKRNATLIGTEMDVLVDGSVERDSEVAELLGDYQGQVSLARTYADAPEIDCKLYLKGEAPSGSFVRARISEVADYDLVGEIMESIDRPDPYGILPEFLRPGSQGDSQHGGQHGGQHEGMSDSSRSESS